jgi:hypothetical protein
LSAPTRHQAASSTNFPADRPASPSADIPADRSPTASRTNVPVDRPASPSADIPADRSPTASRTNVPIDRPASPGSDISAERRSAAAGAYVAAGRGLAAPSSNVPAGWRPAAPNFDARAEQRPVATSVHLRAERSSAAPRVNVRAERRPVSSRADHHVERRPPVPRIDLHADLWRQATEVRREWLEIGLSTEPADRPTAEQAITEIYARHRRDRPRFIWVQSPRAALPFLDGLPTHETLRAWIADRRPPGAPPLAADIAAGLSRLRSALADAYTEPPRDRPPMKRKKAQPWPLLPANEALAAGLPFQELLRQGVHESLFRSLSGIYLPIRAALSAQAPAAGSVPVGWYGQQDASWIAHFDAQRRLGLAHRRESPAFDTWAALSRSAGWWWPAEDRCILVDRPAVIDVEPTPGTWHGEVRPRRATTHPTIEYRDGWTVHPATA